MRWELVAGPVLIVVLWVMTRPTSNPMRIRARTASQLTEIEWFRLGKIHGVEEYHRERRTEEEKRDRERRITSRMETLSQEWRKNGWTDRSGEWKDGDGDVGGSGEL